MCAGLACLLRACKPCMAVVMLSTEFLTFPAKAITIANICRIA